MTTRVLAVANQKGGVAKTTTVASLGAAMVDARRRVLLVDLDPQGCLTFSLGQDPDKLAVSVHEVLLGEVEQHRRRIFQEFYRAEHNIVIYDPTVWGLRKTELLSSMGLLLGPIFHTQEPEGSHKGSHC